MLETLTAGFRRARERLAGVTTLSEANLDEALADVRRSLLEADVDYGVVKDFLERVREKSLGARVETKVRDAAGPRAPRDAGPALRGDLRGRARRADGSGRRRRSRPRDGVTSVLLLGLQGVGKTTVAAKLARRLQKQGHRPLLVAADVQRPAAVQQLQRSARRSTWPCTSARRARRRPRLCAARAGARAGTRASTRSSTTPRAASRSTTS